MPSMKRVPYLALTILSSVVALLPVGARASGEAAAKLEPPQLAKWGSADDWPQVRNDLGLRIPDKAREARVELRFTVTKEGRTADIEVEGGFYSDAFREKAVEMMKESRWKPALLDGKPSDYPDEQLAITFRLEKSELGKPFLDAMNEAVALVQAGKLEAAHVQVEEMVAHKVKWLYEYVMLQAGLAETFQKTGYPLEAVRASKLATATYNGRVPPFVPGGKAPRNSARNYMLPEPILTTTLQRRFILDVLLGQDRDAIQAYGELQGLGTLEPDSRLAPLAMTITTRMQSDAPLVGKARIDEHGEYRHHVYRKTFSVLDVTGGQLHTVFITCSGVQHALRREMEIRDGVEWKLPERARDCWLVFKGDAGTQFKVVELGSSPEPVEVP